MVNSVTGTMPTEDSVYLRQADDVYESGGCFGAKRGGRTGWQKSACGADDRARKCNCH